MQKNKTMYLIEILLELELLLLVERLQNLRRVGLRDGDGIETFALKVDDEAVGLVVEHAHLLDVDDIGTVAAHQRAGIHTVVGDGLHLAAEQIAGDDTAPLVKHVDVVVLRLDVIEVVELDGQFQVAVVVHQVDDFGVLRHHLVVRLHRVTLGEHEALSGVFQQDRQYGDRIGDRQGNKSDEDTFGIKVSKTMVCGLNLKIRDEGMTHRNDHDFEE